MIRSRLDRPVASISFDDFAQTAWTAGGHILQSAGVRGTYFVSGSYCRREADGIKYFEPDDLVAAHGNGHEIACHTFDHRTVSTLTASEIEASIKRNLAFVRKPPGDVMMNVICFSPRRDVGSHEAPPQRPFLGMPRHLSRHQQGQGRSLPAQGTGTGSLRSEKPPC